VIFLVDVRLMDEQKVREQLIGELREARQRIAELETAELERKRADESVQHLLDQQIAINELALTLGEYRDIGKICHVIYEHVRTLMDARAFIVSFYDSDTRLIRAGYVVVDGAVCDTGDLPPIPLEEVGRGTQSQVVCTGEPFYAPDWREAMGEIKDEYTVAENGTVGEGPLLPEEQEDFVNSALLVPMKIEGETIGVVQVRSHRLDAYSQEDIDLLSAMASVAAVAIQNARLYAEQQRRAEEAGVLLEIANTINSRLEPDRILKEVAIRAARACGASRCTILLLDEHGETLQPIMSQFASGREDREMWRLFKGERYPQKVEDVPEAMRAIQTRLPLFIPDARASSLPRHWVEPFGVGSVLIVPLISRERVVGLMGLDHLEISYEFTRGQVHLAMTIGGQAAVAIENARLHRELQDHAHELEQRVWERTAQLQAQYAQLEAIFDSSSDGIIVADREGGILQTNPIARAWLSRTLSPDDAARLREAVQDLAARVEERPETVLELAGLDLQLSAAPITEPGMEGAAVMIAVHDVSHLKALDRMKSRFVSNVSHELRTPITTIKLYTELMERKPERWKEYLDVLTQEADRQARLVEDILQISRFDSGRLEMKPRPVSLNELTEMVCVSHQTLAQQRGLTLEHRPAEPGLMALVDPERAMQVLTNLVANAIQYTPEGGKVIVSAGKREVQGRVWATARVADTGMGIPEEELPHVFERFFRGEQPQHLQLSGTGLGLAIAQEIVELHGGRVTVESEVDVGTSFTVWLPLAD
jgi:signal transduction histidine kinase